VYVREKNDGEMQRWGREEREQEWDGRRREREKVQEVMEKIEHMRRNEREGEKGTGRNMERRRQADG
jgi:hypothetical protein